MNIFSVGINKYGGGSSLYGCVNDVGNLHTALQAMIYQPDTRWIMTDKEATGAKIRDGLKWLQGQGGTVIFQYSGHGTLIADKSGDEADKIDGAIVPVDYGKKGVILDDEIAAFVDKATKCKVILLFDSCYAGETQRGALIKASERLLRRPIPRFIQTKATPPNSTLINYDSKKFLDINSERSVLVATSQPTVTSADAYIDNKYQGAGTYAMIRAWRQLGRTASYLRVQEVANAWLLQNRYEQRITLGGTAANLQKPFLT